VDTVPDAGDTVTVPDAGDTVETHSGTATAEIVTDTDSGGHLH
jgi:hypothetical protein